VEPQRISVIIPCYNGQEVLEKSLSTLLNQTVPAHEIIVVDDGSDDPVTVPDGVRLIRIERSDGYRGSSAAKNLGARRATGDWLAFTDDDILHMPDAIECVTGRIQDIEDDTLITIFSLGVPDGLLSMIDWKSGDSESMECLLDSFRKQRKLYGNGKDGVVPNKNVGRITGLLLDTQEPLLVSSEQHFGVISKRFFNVIKGYDADTFKSWGFNNQDLCLSVLRHGGWIVSNVTRSTGEILHCFHARTTDHDPTIAKDEFFAKYGKRYSPLMLLEAGATCLTRK
jgi:glycosyltransferase involved in cell wall biosynthesis